MDGKTCGLPVRDSKNRRRAAGLYPRDAAVQSSLHNGRKERGAVRTRASSHCSEIDAGSVSRHSDRAHRRRRDAYVQFYHVWFPGQTGMCSPSALGFPELAAGRGANP
jgi:hypothetical protein